ncbi:glyoxalase, partial [Streptomyces goshikiensis]
TYTARAGQRPHTPTPHPSPSPGALLCLRAAPRPAAHERGPAAVGAGATEPRPAQDYGTMYGRAFEDLDGHTWEIMWMDPAMIES